MKKKIKRVIYYILLTIAFLILPFSIRNVYYAVLIKENFFYIITQVLAGTFIFLYPFGLALLLRHNIKYNKWPFEFIEEFESEDDKRGKIKISRTDKK
jgi:putative effector of murein hydrolase LrgA (UPF0299 family)